MTGLVLIDLLNDFIAEDGKLYPAVAAALEDGEFVARLRRLIAGARAAGIKVFYGPHGLDEHSFDDVRQVHPTFRNALKNQVFWKGTHGADFYPALRPEPGDVVVSRHRMYDSFKGTDLEQQLKLAGAERIVLAGFTSGTCVEGTGRHALEDGYHVTFLSDGVADFDEASHRAAVDIAYPAFGHAVLTVDEFLIAVDKNESQSTSH
ncbi:cysteine hydrolase family protein [Lentzea cavernae]|nr:isochorismatase family cysteine hydrolase [Lentzea cavernae]